MKRSILLVIALLAGQTQAQPLTIFDTHLHYNSDARQHLSTEEVIQTLKDANITQVLVSSTDDAGTQLLVEAAPTLFLPALRPYRRAGETKTWMYDPSVIDHLESKLAQNSYLALGEFHAFEEHIQLPVVQAMVDLARQHNLVLHHHGDYGAVEALYESWPQARLLWAHAGFEEPDTVRLALQRYPNLWVDLSHRPDISTWAGLALNWSMLFEEFPERFVLGSDTYTLERWQKVGFYALDARDWLSVLPDEVAQNIAYRNAQRLFDLD